MNPNPTNARPIGRRPGTPGTREAILLAARRCFANRGYDATSLRTIATEAQVDPALLIHYFGSKDGLFRAALGLSARPSEMFGEVSTLDLPAASDAIARGFLKVIDGESGHAIYAMVRSAVSNENAASLLRHFLAAEILNVLCKLTDDPDAPMRASLAAAQLVGIAILRQVVKVEPLASASPDQLVPLVAPVIEQYLK